MQPLSLTWSSANRASGTHTKGGGKGVGREGNEGGQGRQRGVKRERERPSPTQLAEMAGQEQRDRENLTLNRT